MLMDIGTRVKLNAMMLQHKKKLQENLSKPNPFGTEEFVQIRQVFRLHRFKLHKHLVDGTVKSVWFRQVFGLLRVWFGQVSL